MEINKVKALCICDSGNVRSGCLARLIKKLGGEAISVGQGCSTENSFRLFGNWATIIFDMSSDSDHVIDLLDESRFDSSGKSKVIRCDIGPDKWWMNGSIYNPELIEECLEIIKTCILEKGGNNDE